MKRKSHLSTFRQRLFRLQANDRQPVKLTHDRIYILPTRRGWLFLISLLIMLITTMNYALGLGYALCFLLSGLFSSALLATYRNLAGIALQLSANNSVTSGDPLDFDLTLHNPSAQNSFVLKVKNSAGNETLMAELEAGKTAAGKLTVTAGKRGWQSCGRLTITSDYPLGLWYAWGYLHTPCRALVYPQAESDAPPVPQALPANTDSDEEAHYPQPFANRQATDPVGIKPYSSGDAISAIDWKASARGRGLHVREFNDQSSPDTLVLDWQQTIDLPDIEARVSRLTSWVQQCHAEGSDWTLQLPDAFISRTGVAQTTSDNSLVNKQLSDHVVTGEQHGQAGPDDSLLHCSLRALALTGHAQTDDARPTNRAESDKVTTLAGVGTRDSKRASAFSEPSSLTASPTASGSA